MLTWDKKNLWGLRIKLWKWHIKFTSPSEHLNRVKWNVSWCMWYFLALMGHLKPFCMKLLSARGHWDQCRCWSMRCCFIYLPNLSFIPPTISENINPELISIPFSIWLVPNSATKEMQGRKAFSNLPYSAANSCGSPLPFKTKLYTDW